MEDTSFFDRMIRNLRSTSKYYTGYPKDLGPSKIISFTSEREFIQLLHEGHPVAVAFTIKCPFTKHFDKVLEEAYPGLCITRRRKDYPYIEIFHSPQQQTSDANTTKYAVKVLPFNYDVSTCGFMEFFKRHGIQSSEPK
ncbi:hypothetical protein MKW98_000251 [Papaver atlanticum]|uniref:Thioredoxin domain-containing protein n=1 Tax=Papaver atlanticum TaxID=357466 RepID=A0AAD4S6C1_9MAGN|nr:hypothetical protein MKW98_000251 [Papaver atlanticum]